MALALAAGAPAGRGQDPAELVSSPLRDASRALQSGNAALFMAAFDRGAFAGYEELRESVSALAAQQRIASSVAIGVPRGGPDEWRIDVDWLIELTPKLGAGQLQRRRELVAVTVGKWRGKWRIKALEPVSLFAPIAARGPPQ